jgi:RimJ/RimL family protein N-acetyltransferase
VEGEKTLKVNQHAKTQGIMLVFYEEMYQAALEGFYLTEEQLNFTASPKAALEISKTDKDRHPTVFLSGDVPVGFFVLHVGENIRPFTSNPNAILLRAFSIDFEHQGKGFAKEVLRILPDFVGEHFHEVDEIVLAVNETNPLARRLYEKSGFIDKGFRRKVYKGEQIILHYPLLNT